MYILAILEVLGCFMLYKRYKRVQKENKKAIRMQMNKRRDTKKVRWRK